MGGSDYLLEPLSQREREILRLLAEGLSDKEIADILILAQGTIKWYNKQIYSKLGVHSRMEAVDKAREWGLLSDIETGVLSGTITFLFTDIEGSTALWERFPDGMEPLLAQHDQLLQRCVEQNHGIIVKTTGDGLLAAFGRARDGVIAALAAQRALAEECQDPVIGKISVRMALHTGTAEQRDGDYYGPAVNRAARLMAVGHGGQILVSTSTRALVQDGLPNGLSLRNLGQHLLKDLTRPETIYQLTAPDLPVDFPPLVCPQEYSSKLPVQLTTFVGREQEMKVINRLLSANRLLTLTGPPGTGKTRLAIHIAEGTSGRYRDGVFFVDLSSISDPQLVINTIAQIFNLQETAGQALISILTYHLHRKQLLLILDNFEQIIKAAPLLVDLLSDCPELKFLITSREPLRIYGEQVYTVPPLAIPDSVRSQPLQKLLKYDAVELFCQRARAVEPDFSLTEENVQSISEICVRLDGLPLAIELAAARSRLLSPQSMLDRLQGRLLTLTSGARDLPARLQTLKAAIDWSYKLLEVDEQRLFDRLSVFQGGRTIEAVETVCGSDLSFPILDGLESLLNKNLLYSKEGRSGGTRFYMLEIIHEYARKRLALSAEADDFRLRHAMYFVTLAERAEAEFYEVKQEYWYARLIDELDNVRAALSWTLDGIHQELGARLVAAMREFWYWKGLLSEGSAWIDRALAVEGRLSPAVWAKTYNASSLMTYARGDFAGGARLAQRALSIARDVDEVESCAWAYLFLSSSLMESDGKDEVVLSHAEEALRLFRDLDHKGGIALGLNTLGELARLHGDYTRAGQLYRECLDLAINTGNRQRIAVSQINLSYVAYHEGNYCQAIEYGQEALALFDTLKVDHAIAVALSIVAGPIGASGEPESAARLLASSEVQMKAIGASFKPVDEFEVDQYRESVREQLGEPDFSTAWAEGRAMTMEQALALAMGNTVD